ncbi:probable rhamnogalacturonate lyase B [Tanacetum coccineum]
MSSSSSKIRLLFLELVDVNTTILPKNVQIVTLEHVYFTQTLLPLLLFDFPLWVLSFLLVAILMLVILFMSPQEIDGPTLWEIGIPDRSAAEFCIPDPDPMFRQYGLWERYASLYPSVDLIFTIGESDYKKDWFYAHVTRKKDDITPALASAQVSDLQVRVNNQNKEPPLFSTGLIGGDNAIARHGIHGLYWLFNIDIPGSHISSAEENSIYLTQNNGGSPFRGVMYDYIRLEGPPPS